MPLPSSKSFQLVREPRERLSHSRSFLVLEADAPEREDGFATVAPSSSMSASTRAWLQPSAQSFSLSRSPLRPPSSSVSDSTQAWLLPSAQSFSLSRSAAQTPLPSVSDPAQKVLLPSSQSFLLSRSGRALSSKSPDPAKTIAQLNPQSFTLIESPSSFSIDPSELHISDASKRTFLKAAGIAGLGLAGTLLMPKKAEAFILGSSPTTGVVGVKDENDARINPATEETLDQVLKTSDLTFDGGALEVKITSVAGDGSSSFSDSGDVAKSALVDGDRHVQVDVLSSALPTSASTETTLQTISFGGYKFTTLYDETGGTYDYVGEASIGTATSAASWRIKRIDNTSGIIIQYADTGVFDQVWDDRASLSYS